MSKPSKDSLIVAASLLTVAEAIFGMPGPSADHGGSGNPPVDAYDSFREHLARLEKDYPQSKDQKKRDD